MKRISPIGQKQDKASPSPNATAQGTPSPLQQLRNRPMGGLCPPGIAPPPFPLIPQYIRQAQFWFLWLPPVAALWVQ